LNLSTATRKAAEQRQVNRMIIAKLKHCTCLRKLAVVLSSTFEKCEVCGGKKLMEVVNNES
tara:strand:- start:1577 stop:1759 length:183 start_codon:yes stop_codon:yes gene_type:complete